MENTILQTKRLNVSIPTINSLDNWYKLQSDKDVMRYVGDGKPRTLNGAKESLQRFIKHYQTYGFCFFDIYEKNSNEFIGTAGLIYLALDHGLALFKPRRCIHDYLAGTVVTKVD